MHAFPQKKTYFFGGTEASSLTFPPELCYNLAERNKERTMKQYLDDAVKSIMESVSFDSSLAPACEGMPFGKGAADCLNHFLTLARSMGFETHNYDNYVGEVLFGEGEAFAVLAHLDVVPAGQGWNTDPFTGILKEGKIFGRGTMDDKGPAVASLYAMKALKDEGFRPRKTIKLIVGCNEECGWACIDHYKKVATMPEIGFSPDANFPVIYAEKGIAHVEFHFPVSDPPFASFSGGERANMVCDRCEATPNAFDERKATEAGMTYQNGVLVSLGKSAHGSTPEEGVNAMLPMLNYFSDHTDVKRVIRCLFDDEQGLKQLCDETGNLTLSPDVVRFENGVLSVLTDIRYPATVAFERVTEKLDAFGVPYEIASHQLPLFQDKNSELVSTLCAVYNRFTGKNEQPIAIGGGTYARALKCGAAFGPEIEGEEVTIHQANEYITIERIQLMLDVYKQALYELTK